MKNKKLLSVLIVIILLAGFFYIRNSSEAGQDFSESVLSVIEGDTEAAAPEVPQDAAPVEEDADAEPAEAPVEAESEAPAPVGIKAEEKEEETLDEDGVYDSKEDVALYLHLYHHLPSNFITKDEAKEKGWSGSGGDKLDKYCPGKCIGGDYFGNYENVLPKGKYRECDIGTLGQKSRGVKRIVYSSDWHIYYTEDHYESFELLYEP